MNQIQLERRAAALKDMRDRMVLGTIIRVVASAGCYLAAPMMQDVQQIMVFLSTAVALMAIMGPLHYAERIVLDQVLEYVRRPRDKKPVADSCEQS